MIDDCSGALFQDILSELLHIRIEEHGQHGAKEVLQWLDVQKDILWLLLDRRWCLILIHGQIAFRKLWEKQKCCFGLPSGTS